MEQKRSRGLFEKAENASVRNTPAQKENTLCPKAPSKKRFEGKRERLTGGPTSQVQTRTELAGARRLRWSPALIHGEVGGSEGTYGFTMSFRVGGWWAWPSASTTSTAALSPADGGSGEDETLRRELQTSN